MFVAAEANAHVRFPARSSAELCGWRRTPPEVIAQEIVEDLEAALVEFTAVAQSLASRSEE
jgi:hypothetical protein